MAAEDDFKLDEDVMAEVHEVDEQLGVQTIGGESSPRNNSHAHLPGSSGGPFQLEGQALRAPAAQSHPRLVHGVSENGPDDIKMAGMETASDSGLSDEEEPFISNPSTDIHSDLENILNGNYAENFKGLHAFSRAYTDAPNPGLELHVNDIGIVGLPLSKREAEVIKSGCRVATEHTLFDTVHGAWVIDHSQLILQNPGWDGFIQRVLRDICWSFGVDVEHSRPHCKLSQLLLIGTDSHDLSYAHGASELECVFARAHIVLPSQFAGGAMQISHGQSCSLLDEPQQSILRTTAYAWHADAMPTMQPISSGYRIALSYDLLYAPETPRPSLPDDCDAAAELLRVLLSWKQSIDAHMPRKIIYLLDGYYPNASLRDYYMTGADAHKVTLLDKVARQHGFELGLATFERFLSGQVKAPTSARDFRRVAPFEDIIHEQSHTQILNLVNLDGEILEDDVNFEEKDLIPYNAADVVENGLHDEEELYEDCDVVDIVERWYRRTAVVIWPRDFDLSTNFTNDIASMARELANARPGKPHKRERRHVELLLSLAQTQAQEAQKSEIARAICTVACVWRDPDLWGRAAESCGATIGVKAIGADATIRAVETFSFHVMQPKLEEMVVTEDDSTALFHFLDALGDWASRDNSISNQHVIDWVSVHCKLAMEHLTQPEKDAGEALLRAALKCGGFDLLQQVFVPQLCRIASPTFLLSFVDLLGLEKAKAHVSPHVQARISEICTELLSAAVRRTSFDRAKPIAKPGSRAPTVPDASMAVVYFDACLATDDDELLNQLVTKLTSAPLVAMAAWNHAKLLLVPLLSLVNQRLNARPANAPSLPSIKKLYESTLRQYFNNWPADQVLTRDIIEWMFEVSIAQGGINFMERTLWPIFCGTGSNVELTEHAILEFIDILRTHAHELPSSPTGCSVKSLTSEVVRRALEKTDVGAWPSRLPMATREFANSKACRFLDLCCDTDNTAYCAVILKRLLAPRSLTPDYVERVLVPFLPELSGFLARRGLDPSQEPFNSAFKATLMLWGKKVLGKKPSEAPADFTSTLQLCNCRCTQCTAVFGFLSKESSEQSYRLNGIGATLRKHVEVQLSRYASKCAVWQTVRSSPQGLVVTKHDALYKPAKWKAAKARTPSILASITPDAEQLQKILGDDHTVIMMMLEGHIPGPNALPLMANIARTTNSALSLPVVEPPSYGQTHTQTTGAPSNIPTTSAGPIVRFPPAAPSLGASATTSSPRRGARTKVAGRPSASTLPTAASTSGAPTHLSAIHRPRLTSLVSAPRFPGSAKLRGIANLGPRREAEGGVKSSQLTARPNPAASPQRLESALATQSASSDTAVTPTSTKEPVAGFRPRAEWRTTPSRPLKRRRTAYDPDDVIDLTSD